jgi:hypothetical protein
MPSAEKIATASTRSKIVWSGIASLVLTGVSLLILSVLGRAGFVLVPVSAFFPFPTIGFYFCSGAGPSVCGIVGTAFGILQIAGYGTYLCHSWIHNRLRSALLTLLSIHLLAVVVAVAVSFFMRSR